MGFLTKHIGPFPLGIWVVLILMLTTGLFLNIFGQGLSLVSWDTAFSLGMQEDSPHSSDIVERMMVAISWGEAGTDVLVQGPLIVMALIGILRRRPFGFLAGFGLAVIWIYVTLLVTIQRIALYKWDLVDDLSRAKSMGPLMFAFVGIPGTVMLVCLMANRRFFEAVKSD